MPPSPSHIGDLLTAYLARHPGERGALEPLLTALGTDGGPAGRTALLGHVTCSAVVIDRDRRVLHVRHRATGLPLAPGGHVEDSDESLPAAALRRAVEEVGIPASFFSPAPGFEAVPIDVDVHDIARAPAPAKGEPALRHYDFRFAFRLADDAPEPAPQAGEGEGTCRLPFDGVTSPGLRAKLGASDPDGGRSGEARPVPSPLFPSGSVPQIVGVHLWLERDGKVLLGLRHPDSAYAGSLWHFLAGHCEAESATACLAREAYEEAGLVVDPADLGLVHVVHLLHRPGVPPRVQLFFRADRWKGVPELREPDKCAAWRWWDPEDLPDALVPYARAAIEGVGTGRLYTETGWPG
ncbi:MULTISPECIES: NUDIX domain-containing protein [unclassified Streptomyces]|uniref:NUDIX domain-containing protein n=1 Tax=unclassified Streptomyces TaxID=2593676 RepID=UPI00382AA7EF